MAFFYLKRRQFEAVQATVPQQIVIDPIEGPTIDVEVGDWLVTTPSGVFPLKPATFNEIFEPV